MKFENVHFISSFDNKIFDENTYINIRKKEGRIYSDDILMNLPDISKTHPLFSEWEVRKDSMLKLIKYFSDKKNLSILDVGCGNGWLSNAISLNTNNYVTALDVNKTELLQGARVFNNNKKLKFIYGNIFKDIFPHKSFDVIVFSSSVQYFNDFNNLIRRIFYFLKKDGEVHIIDSNFYSLAESNKAKERTINYYKYLGCPEMINYYYHHTGIQLREFNYKILNQKELYFAKIKKILGVKSKPLFPWVLIIKD